MREIKNTIVQCPNCGASHYFENYSTATAIAYCPEWKDGLYQFNDPNYYTTYCSCANCGSEFSYTEYKGGITTTLLNKQDVDTEKLKGSIYKIQKSWSASAEELYKDRIESLKARIKELQEELEELEFNEHFIRAISCSPYKPGGSCGE